MNPGDRVRALVGRRMVEAVTSWRSIQRSIRGRIWIDYMGMPSRGRWRYYLFPWFGGDEYHRKTLVLPAGLHIVVIALWEHRDRAEPGCDPYVSDPIWMRWKAVRAHGRLER
ncbi:hypothetical protein [Nocardia sp. CC227C]|uniref:hypothetical protein n=1 Tax=Nocardia sp. CC227C TaxID=3044562 RepID=UPI00278C5FFA|nr:hypothetical protein [Nocardia sp. CC227C]